MGHSVDADTFALWRFAETAHGTTGITDTVGGYNLVASGTAPGFTNADGNRYARVFGNTNKGAATSLADRAAVRTALQGEWTIMSWVRLYASQANYLFAYAGTDDSEAANIQAQIYFDASNNLSCRWEQGAGTDVDSVQSGGDVVANETWTHVAVRKSADGGNYQTEFFVGGVAQGSPVTGLANATGGTNARFILGRTVDLSGAFHGEMRGVAIYDSALSDQDIADSAASATLALSSTDAFALWGMTEDQPEAIDETAAGRHLCSNNTGLVLPHLISRGVYGDGEPCRYFPGTGTYTDLLFAWDNEGDWEALLEGEWSIEFFFLPTNGASTNFGYLGFVGDTASRLAVLSGSTHTPWFQHDGTNYFGGDVLATSQGWYDVRHLAIVRRDAGATHSADWYVNGTLVDTITGIPDAMQATGNNTKFVLGGAAAVFFTGLLDEVKLSSVARTAEEIAEDAAFYSAPAPGEITIGSYVPSLATVPTKRQALQFDVTSTTTVADATVNVSFSDDDSEPDVVYEFGEGFKGVYNNANSSVTAIAGGYRFVVYRAGGWPGAPQFDVRAKAG